MLGSGEINPPNGGFRPALTPLSEVVSRFFANWFAGSGINEVSQQWGRPQRQHPGASYSYTSCCPTGYRPHAQTGTDQHESRVSVREAANHTSAAADPPVYPFNDIIGTDAGPVFAGKIAVG